MGGKGSGSSQPQYVQGPPQTTTTTTQPWSAQIPYLQEVFKQAQTNFQTPMQFYSGSVSGVPVGQTYAPFSPETKAAMAMTKAQAFNDPVVSSAQNYTTDVLSGKYLMADNPYFNNMVGNIYRGIAPQVESQFSKSGRYGSGAMDKALASSVSDTAGNLAYQNYTNAMDQMSKAAYLSPQMAELGYLPAQKIGQIGGMLEDQTQNAINQAMQQWQFNQMEPWQRLGLYAGNVQGNYGGTSTSTGSSGQWVQPGGSNSWGNAIGGLSSLAGLGMLGFSLFSDKRTKTNIKPLKDGLNTLNKIKPVSFTYKPEYGGTDEVGFVADDLEKVIPGLVHKDKNGIRMVAPMGLIPVLFKAVQEQQSQINELRK